MYITLKFADGRVRTTQRPPRAAKLGLPLEFLLKEELPPDPNRKPDEPDHVKRWFKLIWEGGKPVYVETEKGA